MKTLISTLFLGAGLVLGGCGDKEKNSERIEYSIRDTLNNPILTDGYDKDEKWSGRFNGVLLTYLAVKDKDCYLLTVKGNIDNKYSKIIFADMDNNNSINMEDYVTFYKNDSIDTHLGYNGVVKGLWKTNEFNEFYNASDSSKLSQEIIKEARNQMENYFNPLYKKLRKRADSLHNKKINLENKEKVNNFFN